MDSGSYFSEESLALTSAFLGGCAVYGFYCAEAGESETVDTETVEGYFSELSSSPLPSPS